jgi:hypothetical protein
MGNNAAGLFVALVAMFALIGLAAAAMVRLVRNDTEKHDRAFVWRNFPLDAPEDNRKPADEEGE